MSSSLLGVKPPTPKQNRQHPMQQKTHANNSVQKKQLQQVQLQPKSKGQSPFAPSARSQAQGKPELRHIEYQQNTEEAPTPHTDQSNQTKQDTLELAQQKTKGAHSRPVLQAARQLEPSRVYDNLNGACSFEQNNTSKVSTIQNNGQPDQNMSGSAVPAQSQVKAFTLASSLTRRQNKSAPSQSNFVTSNQSAVGGASGALILQRPSNKVNDQSAQQQLAANANSMRRKRYPSGHTARIIVSSTRANDEALLRGDQHKYAVNLNEPHSRHEEIKQMCVPTSEPKQQNFQFGPLPISPGHANPPQPQIPKIKNNLRVLVNKGRRNTKENINSTLPEILTREEVAAAGISSLASNQISHGQRTKKQFRRQVNNRKSERKDQNETPKNNLDDEREQVSLREPDELVSNSSLPPIYSPNKLPRESSSHKQHIRRGKGIQDLAPAMPKTSRHLTYHYVEQATPHELSLDLNQAEFPYKLECTQERNQRLNQNHTQLITKSKANLTQSIDNQEQNIRMQSARQLKHQLQKGSQRGTVSVNRQVATKHKTTGANKVVSRRTKTLNAAARKAVASTHAEQKLIQQQMLFQSSQAYNDAESVAHSVGTNKMLKTHEPLIDQNQFMMHQGAHIAITPTKPMRKTWHGQQSRGAMTKQTLVLPVQTIKMSESKAMAIDEDESSEAVNSQTERDHQFNIVESCQTSGVLADDASTMSQKPFQSNLPARRESKRATYQASSEKISRKSKQPAAKVVAANCNTDRMVNKKAAITSTEVLCRSQIQKASEEEKLENNLLTGSQEKKAMIQMEMRKQKGRLRQQIQKQKSQVAERGTHQNAHQVQDDPIPKPQKSFVMVTPTKKRTNATHAPLQTLNEEGKSPSPLKRHINDREVLETEVTVSINWQGSDSSSHKSLSKNRVQNVIAKDYKDSPQFSEGTSRKDTGFVSKKDNLNLVPEKSHHQVQEDTNGGFIELVSQDQSTSKKPRKSKNSHQFTKEKAKTFRFSSSAQRHKRQHQADVNEESNIVERTSSDNGRAIIQLYSTNIQHENITEVVSESHKSSSIDFMKTDIKSDYPMEQSEDNNLQSNEFGDNDDSQAMQGEELREMDQELKAQLSNVQRGELLGEGTFGRVYQGMYKGKNNKEEARSPPCDGASKADKAGRVRDDQDVGLKDLQTKQGGKKLSRPSALNKLPPKMAIKVVRAEDKRLLSRLYHECELLKTLVHPNIVTYYGCLMNDQHTEASIFMELMPHSLKTLNFGPMNEHVLRRHTRQILSALEYLHNHEKKIIHGDLKAANILYDGEHVKLTDFGDSRIMCAQVPNLSVSHSGVTFKDIKGSILWMAPEIIQEKPIGTRSDIWSLGCTMIELATAERPWPKIKDLSQLFDLIVANQAPEIPDHLSEDAQDFISQCLQYDKDKRPCARDLLQHPFVNDQDQQPILNH